LYYIAIGYHLIKKTSGNNSNKQADAAPTATTTAADAAMYNQLTQQ
jgi:hypothetical protein